MITLLLRAACAASSRDRAAKRPPVRGMGGSALPFFVNDPKHWQERAEEARALADMLTDARARSQMVEVAAAYDRMAERAANSPIKSPLTSKEAV